MLTGFGWIFLSVIVDLEQPILRVRLVLGWIHIYTWRSGNFMLYSANCSLIVVISSHP